MDIFETSESAYTDWVTASAKSSDLLLCRLERRICAAAASVWPTANVMDSKDSARHTTKTGVMHPGTTLTDAIRQWPSPPATWGEAGNKSRSGARQDEMLIGAMAREVSKQWATPRAEDSESAGMRHGRGVADTLTAQVRNANWATPTASDHTGALKTTTGRNLRTDVALFPTPAARDYRTPNASSFQARSGTTKGEQLPNFVAHCFRPVLLINGNGPTSSSTTRTLRQRLNPAFVCWLMGWPTWWTNPELTSSELLATEWSLWLARSRSMLALLTSDFEVTA